MAHPVVSNQSPQHTHSLGQGAPKSKGHFNPDDAVNAAINLQVDMILNLSDITLSMSSMDATLQETGVANTESMVEMYRALLSAQGLCCNSTWFKKVIEGWSKANHTTYPENAAGFMKYLKTLGSPYTKIFSGVFNNPNMTSATKDKFASIFASFYNQCNGHLSSFLNKGSVIAQQLTQASTNVSNWQSIADSMKPTQIQQATTELVAEIGAESSMWTDVVAS